MRASTKAVALFFAKRPYRFLWLTIVGAFSTFAGVVGCYGEIRRGLSDSVFGFWAALIAFMLYVVCGVWYWSRIRAGTWQRIWMQIIEKSR